MTIEERLARLERKVFGGGLFQRGDTVVVTETLEDLGGWIISEGSIGEVCGTMDDFVSVDFSPGSTLKVKIQHAIHESKLAKKV